MKLSLSTLRMLSIAGLAATGFVGVWCLITCKLTDLKLKIVMLYLPVFSSIALCTEFMFGPIATKFQFLRNWMGKAVFFIFLGTLELGSGVAGWIVGLFMIVFGLVIIFLRAKKPDIFLDDEAHGSIRDTEPKEKKEKEKKPKKEKKEKASSSSSNREPAAASEDGMVAINLESPNPAHTQPKVEYPQAAFSYK
eukprot:TRINITY_DN80167_c0_g1_i1.p1 TRINITY_DN80167_c0_g1~~TRINITY_DN80167_c0_g1_i1.p1  ORF type:complete len:194 (+),score=44.04 TRINITY_DN80167_c0_g1_i1:51-632(+)